NTLKSQDSAMDQLSYSHIPPEGMVLTEHLGDPLISGDEIIQGLKDTAEQQAVIAGLVKIKPAPRIETPAAPPPSLEVELAEPLAAEGAPATIDTPLISDSVVKEPTLEAPLI